MRRCFLALAVVLLPVTSPAQDTQTLADIRQELTVLYVEVQRLRRELSTTGSPGLAQGGGSLLDRVNAIESEMVRLTAKTEDLEFRVNRIIEDGTNRIGDLEFRLVELEGGDLSLLGETTTLGGDLDGAALPVQPAPADNSLAIGEQGDFARAESALEAGDYFKAADQFELFNQTYPGGPLAAAADLGRGQALEKLGDNREAARAYLSSFKLDQTGQTAPRALFLLGRSLGTLGQMEEACVTLGEVGLRFAQSGSVQDAQEQMQAFGCQ
jgi:tol-pal system protein YbgF